MKKYLLINIFYLIVIIVALILIIFSYIKAPVHLESYKIYKDKIINDLIDENLKKNIYKEFIKDYKNYNKLYKNSFITIVIFSAINLIANIWNIIIIYKNKQINLNFKYLCLCFIIYFCIFYNYILIGSLSDTHYYIKFFIMDLMEENDSKKFIKAGKNCERYELISCYLYLFLMFLHIYINFWFSNSQQNNNNLDFSNENLREERIKKCKKEKYNPSKFLQTQLCSVCQFLFEDKVDILILPCNHIFHFDCINNWLKNNNTCPIDRKEILN